MKSDDGRAKMMEDTMSRICGAGGGMGKLTKERDVVAAMVVAVVYWVRYRFAQYSEVTRVQRCGQVPWYSSSQVVKYSSTQVFKYPSSFVQ